MSLTDVAPTLELMKLPEMGIQLTQGHQQGSRIFLNSEAQVLKPALSALVATTSFYIVNTQTYVTSAIACKAGIQRLKSRLSVLFTLCSESFFSLLFSCLPVSF